LFGGHFNGAPFFVVTKMKINSSGPPKGGPYEIKIKCKYGAPRQNSPGRKRRAPENGPYIDRINQAGDSSSRQAKALAGMTGVWPGPLPYPPVTSISVKTKGLAGTVFASM
jgi:hypothetical protein